jgi:hypothetical protein
MAGASTGGWNCRLFVPNASGPSTVVLHNELSIAYLSVPWLTFYSVSAE